MPLDKLNLPEVVCLVVELLHKTNQLLLRICHYSARVKISLLQEAVADCSVAKVLKPDFKRPQASSVDKQEHSKLQHLPKLVEVYLELLNPQVVDYSEEQLQNQQELAYLEVLLNQLLEVDFSVGVALHLLVDCLAKLSNNQGQGFLVKHNHSNSNSRDYLAIYYI